MRRPHHWLHWLFLACLFLVIADYAILGWVAPAVVIRKLHEATGGQLAVDKTRLSFPMTVMVAGLRFAHNTPDSGFSIQRVTIRPRWLSIPTRTLEVDTIDVERPFIRVTRTTTGAMLWPAPVISPAPASTPDGDAAAAAWPASWRMRAHSIKVIDAAIEFVDETPPTPFHALLNHISFVVGPVTMPFEGEQISVALRGAFMGRGGELAPLYCSGWWEDAVGALQVSCRLEPLPLVVFEPYFQQSPTIRVYGATISSTSQWSAKANALEARVQLELGHLDEGDLSVHGRTIVDIKQLAGSPQSRLTGEIALTGPLDDPAQWHGEFIAGNPGTRQLVDAFLERGVKVVKVALGPHRVGVDLAPTSGTSPEAIEAASKEILEALEILATPLPSEPPASETATPPIVSPEAAPPSQAPAPPTSPKTL